MIALADVTDSKRWWAEGGATSSHHNGSKWGQLRLVHSPNAIANVGHVRASRCDLG